jgi:DNA-binding CsgD family transcriptional regulator
MNVLPICETLLAARTEAEFCDALNSAAGSLAFGTFGGFYIPKPAVLARANRSRPFGNIDPRFENWLALEAGLTDPVMQYCKTSSLPMAWNQETYRACGRVHMHEEMAPWGLQSGVALGFHNANGSHFCIGFDSPDPWKAADPGYPERIAAFNMVAVYAQAVAERLYGYAIEPAPSLTIRELEVLRWTADGKTASEVGTILSIADETVNKHLGSAAIKLKCHGKLQCVVRAISLGLLQP